MILNDSLHRLERLVQDCQTTDDHCTLALFFFGAASCSYNLLADPISKYLLDTQNVLHVLDCDIAVKPIRLLLQAEFRFVDGTVHAEHEGYNCEFILGLGSCFC